MNTNEPKFKFSPTLWKEMESLFQLSWVCGRNDTFLIYKVNSTNVIKSMTHIPVT